MRFLAALAVISGLLAGPVLAAERIVVPIAARALPNGAMRYSVPVSVGGGPPVEAMLDTGSVGLRLLPGVVEASRYRPLGRSMRARFGSGVELSGPLARADLTIGGFRARGAVVQVAESAACLPGRETCAAARPGPDGYRISGVFAAILGIGLRPNPADNPLELDGDKAWIVILPRPGEPGPGELILNPTAADRAGFTLFRLAPGNAGGRGGWLDNALAGCLSWTGDSPVCGPTFLDTGTPNLSLVAEGRQVTWRPGLPAQLRFGQAGGPAVDFRFGETPAARMRLSPPEAGHPRAGLNTGVLPYYSFAVLYDAKAGVIGLKARG